MPYVQVPKDLTRVKNKAILNMTFRQIVCFSAAGILGIPVYLLTKCFLGNSAAVLIMIGLMLPFFFLAMFEKDGQPAEKILQNFARAKLWPGVRPYRTENLYRYLAEEGENIAEKKEAAGTAPAKKHRAGKNK